MKEGMGSMSRIAESPSPPLHLSFFQSLFSHAHISQSFVVSFQHNVCTGEGTLTTSDGAVYRGSSVNGLRHGRGIDIG